MAVFTPSCLFVYTVVPELPAISRTLENLPALTAAAVSLREYEFATGSHMFDCPEQIPAGGNRGGAAVSCKHQGAQSRHDARSCGSFAQPAVARATGTREGVGAGAGTGSAKEGVETGTGSTGSKVRCHSQTSPNVTSLMLCVVFAVQPVHTAVIVYAPPACAGFKSAFHPGTALL